MFKKIVAGDPIFATEAFKRDDILFNLFGLIRQSTSPFLLSNGKTAVIAQSAEDAPIWVWTDDKISDTDKYELSNKLKSLSKKRRVKNITSKPEIYNELLTRFPKMNGAIEHLTAYKCPYPVPPRRNDGSLYKPSPKETEVIARFLTDDIEDISGDRTSIDDNISAAEKLIKNNGFYFWKNDQGDIVSMGLITHKTFAQARINTVFTDRNFRNRGYASQLVFKLSKIILNDGLTPMLYADSLNPASNKAYRNIGFESCGDLIILKPT